MQQVRLYKVYDYMYQVYNQLSHRHMQCPDNCVYMYIYTYIHMCVCIYICIYTQHTVSRSLLPPPIILQAEVGSSSITYLTHTGTVACVCVHACVRACMRVHMYIYNMYVLRVYHIRWWCRSTSSGRCCTKDASLTSGSWCWQTPK